MITFNESYRADCDVWYTGHSILYIIITGVVDLAAVDSHNIMHTKESEIIFFYKITLITIFIKYTYIYSFINEWYPTQQFNTFYNFNN